MPLSHLEHFLIQTADLEAFRATGLKDMLAHLTQHKIEFKQRMVSDQGLYQVFLFDPNGVKIEPNFANAEAEGLTADLVASDLAR